jgi:hypothetical protein
MFVQAVLSAFCVAVLIAPAAAQSLRDYKCVVQRVASADASPKHLEFLQKNFVAKEFTIDRRTGVMAGALKNSYLTRPIVVDVGSPQNSFKAVTTLTKEQAAGPGSNAYLLVVNEYVGSPKKPFLFAENEDVYFGTCSHF